jgi:spore germination protein
MAVPPTLLPTSTPVPPPEPEVTVWALYAGGLETQTLTQYAGLIDEVNFVWYYLLPNGKIQGSNLNPSAIKGFQAAGIRVMPAIQNSGYSPDAVRERIADPQKRTEHVQDLVDLVSKENYDGIDIDYESLHAADREIFTLFIEELALALHADGKLLSVTVHPKTSEDGSWEGPRAQDWARLGAAGDLFKIMCYDYSTGSRQGGPIAPVGWADDIITYAATLVPPEKTYLGIPFYGYDYFLGQGTSLNWMSAQAVMKRYEAQLQRDESNEAWFTYDSGGTHNVYFNDALATETKVKTIFARHPHLAGVSIWVLGGEDPQNWIVLGELLNP